ncbi:hypothetical protein D3C80_1195620 [compost metagenome]
MARQRTGPGPPRREPRLRDLHLRLHRQAQGRRRHPRRPGRAPAVDARHLWLRRQRRIHAEGAGQLRRVRLGMLPAAALRQPPGAGGARRAPRPGAHRPTGARTRRERAAFRAGVAPALRRRAATGPMRQPAPAVLRRRSAVGRAARPRVPATAGGATAQPLRPQRNHHQRHPLALPGGRGRHGAHRPPAGQRAVPGAGREPGTRGARRGR